MRKNLTKDAIWRITYTDGEVVWEKDPTSGKVTEFKEVDQTKIKYVDILNPVGEMDDLLKEEVKTRIKNDTGDVVDLIFKTYHDKIIPLIHLEIEEWQRLILFKRRIMRQGAHLAVFGEPEMLDNDLRKKREEETGKSEKRPQTIPYSFEQPKEVVIVIGWQSTIGDKNVKSICLVHSDGHVEMKPDR